MKLLLIGAGYVGMALLNRLQNRGDDIYATTTDPSKIEALKPLTKDVLLLNPSDDKGLKDIIDLCDAMVVLVAPKNGKSYEDTYLNTAKKISQSLKGRKKPFYIIYTSSTSVYQDVKNEWVTEDLNLIPDSENAKTLLESEKLLLSTGDACILRLGGIYGPGREIKKRAAYFSGKEIPGSGDEPTNHIHLDDIISGIIFCLEHRLTGVYNLVNNDHPTRKELYSALCKAESLPLPTWNPELPANKSGYKVSNKKISEAGFNISIEST